MVKCSTCRYLQTYGCKNEYYCSAQKGAPRVYDPDGSYCDRYTCIKKKEEVMSENMIVSPFTTISKPEYSFNGEYWKVGDAYVIKPRNGKIFMSVLNKFNLVTKYNNDLTCVIKATAITLENGMKITIKEFENGDYEIINHISLEHAASKSIACD
jgi:hypothetical protein